MSFKIKLPEQLAENINRLSAEYNEQLAQLTQKYQGPIEGMVIGFLADKSDLPEGQYRLEDGHVVWDKPEDPNGEHSQPVPEQDRVDTAVS